MDSNRVRFACGPRALMYPQQREADDQLGVIFRKKKIFKQKNQQMNK